MTAGPRGARRQPQGTDPAPARAWPNCDRSPAGGGAANPATGDVKTQGPLWIASVPGEEATGALSRRLGPLPREARRPRPNGRQDRPGSGRREDETLSPAGLCAHTAPRPPKGLWEM